VQAVQLFSEVASERRAGWQPQLPLELAFVEATLSPSALAAEIGLPSSTAPAPPASGDAPVASATTAAVTATSPARTPGVRRVPSRPVTAKASSAPTPSSVEQRNPAQKSAAAAALPEMIDASLSTTVNDRWREVVAQVRPINLGAFLRDARPVGVDADGFLVLGFQHTLHCNNVDKESNRSVVETCLSQMFGQRILVRCVLEKDWQPGASTTTAAKTGLPISTGASKPGAVAPPRTRVAPSPILPPPEPPDPLTDDDLLRRAREELGAEVRIG